MTELLSDELNKMLRELHLKDMAEYLDGAIENARINKSGHMAFLADLIRHQIEGRQRRSLERRLRAASLPRNMTFDNFDWNFQPSLDVEHLKDLMELDFVPKRRGVLIFGKTGTGKTHIASSLGDLACKANFRVEFYSLQKLLGMLFASLADDTTDELIAALSRIDLLIIDRIGKIRKKRPEYPCLLLDLISANQETTSFIITSSISFAEWGTVLGNDSITNAIADRLMNNAAVINITQGKSYRTEGPGAAQLPTTD